MTNILNKFQTKIRNLGRNRQEDYDSEDLRLIAQAKLGIEVTQRLGPVLSEYLENQAQMARFRALEKLERVAPTDTAKITALQVEARSAHNALVWLADAVQRGELAEEELRQRDEDERTDG